MSIYVTLADKDGRCIDLALITDADPTAQEIPTFDEALTPMRNGAD
jgi:hypothetical protein